MSLPLFFTASSATSSLAEKFYLARVSNKFAPQVKTYNKGIEININCSNILRNNNLIMKEYNAFKVFYDIQMNNQELILRNSKVECFPDLC